MCKHRQIYLACTSLFSRQWTMKRKVPCWELRMMKSTWKKRLVWYRPRIQVQPNMTNWATILNKITLRNNKGEKFKILQVLMIHSLVVKRQLIPCVLGLRNVTFHVGQSWPKTPQGCTEQNPVQLWEQKDELRLLGRRKITEEEKLTLYRSPSTLCAVTLC